MADFSASSTELKSTVRYLDQIQRASDRFGRARYQNVTKLNSELKLTSRYFDQVYRAARKIQSVTYDTGIQRLNRQVTSASNEFSALYRAASKVSQLQIGISIDLKDHVTSQLNGLKEKLQSFSSLKINAGGTMKIEGKQTADPTKTSDMSGDSSSLIEAIQDNTKAIRSNTTQLLLFDSTTQAQPAEQNKSTGSKIMGVLGSIYTILALVDFSYRGSGKIRQMTQQKKIYPDANAGKASKGKPNSGRNQSSKGKRNTKSNSKGNKRSNSAKSNATKISTSDKSAPKPVPKQHSDTLKNYHDRYGKIRTGESEVRKNASSKGGKPFSFKTVGESFKNFIGSQKNALTKLPKPAFLSSIGEKFNSFKDKGKNLMDKIPGKNLLKAGGKVLGKVAVPLAIVSSAASIFQAPKEERGKAIGSVVGTAAGAFFGGPAGAMVGNYFGGVAGDWIQKSKIIEKGGKAIGEGVDWIGQKFKNLFGKKTPEATTAPSAAPAVSSASAIANPSATYSNYLSTSAAVGSTTTASALNVPAIYQTKLASKVAAKGSTGTKAGSESVQLSEAQLGSISGMLKDFKAEVTNQVSITIPQGAVQLDIHEEIDYAEIEGKIGAAIVAKVRQAFNNYKPSGGGGGSAGVSKVMAT
ncbi:hypothetical protein [Saccharibacillus sp. JS10]|uniref:hypothetical protein n=1 Tax=Saccharibacillus sp. JS10 TaxID=2950552 RepID=UPI00210C610E|nr:hypothetical protein [Saccharibacillus sp. JS10]MCQ4086677.1 hypothetical protein [Saccharibacillus sp. JS10]